MIRLYICNEVDFLRRGDDKFTEAALIAISTWRANDPMSPVGLLRPFFIAWPSIVKFPSG